MEQRLIETDIKELEREVLAIKTAQPYFQGQMDLNLISSSNDYDATITGNFSTPKRVLGFVSFRNDSGILPFARFIVVAKTTPTGSALGTDNVDQVLAVRMASLYSQSTSVGMEFRLNIRGLSTNQTVYFKYYVVTNDTGGTFEVYPNDWSILW